MKYQKPNNFIPPKRKPHVEDFKKGDIVCLLESIYGTFRKGDLAAVLHISKTKGHIYLGKTRQSSLNLSEYYYPFELQKI